MFLAGTYISHWSEGSVYSECSIDTDSLSVVSVEVSDDGEHYEHLESEEVEIEINGQCIYLDAEQGELSEDGRLTLRKSLS